MCLVGGRWSGQVVIAGTMIKVLCLIMVQVSHTPTHPCETDEQPPGQDDVTLAIIKLKGTPLEVQPETLHYKLVAN